MEHIDAVRPAAHLTLVALHDAVTWEGIHRLCVESHTQVLDAAFENHSRAIAASLVERDSARLSTELLGLAALLADCRKHGIASAIRERYVDVTTLSPFKHAARAEPGLDRQASVEDLTRATHELQRALQDRELFLAPPGLRRQLEARASLALTRLAQGTRSWRMSEEALDVSRRALRNSLQGSRVLARVVHNMAVLEMLQADWTSDTSRYEIGTALMAKAVELAAPEPLALSAAQEDLGGALVTSYLASGRPDDLERAITAYREAARLGGTQRPSAHVGLAGALFRLYRRTGDVASMDEAVQAAEDGVAATPPTAPQLPRRLAALADLLRERQQRTRASDHVDLWRALALNQQAVELAERTARVTVPDRRSDLALTLLAAASLTSRADLVEQAVAAARAAVAGTDLTSASALSCLSTLATALLVAHNVWGAPGALEEAVDVFRAVSSRTDKTDTRTSGRLSNLALALQKLYRVQGSLAALEESIEAAETAVQSARPEDVDQDIYKSTLANAYDYRYAVSADRTDLARAIVHYHEAVEACPEDSEGLPVHLGNLGSALIARARLGEYSTDVDSALRLLDEAVARLGPDSAHRPLILNQTVEALLARVNRDESPEDARRAASKAMEALALAPHASPDHFAALIALGHAQAAQAEVLQSLSHDTAAAETWHEAYKEALSVYPSAALAAATAWANRAKRVGNRLDAARAYAAALEAEQRVYRAQILREDKETWLSSTRAMFPNAASVFAGVGDYSAAVLAMETGRARLLSERLDRDRAELDRLTARGHDGLRRAYQAAVTQLNTFDTVIVRRPSLGRLDFGPR